MDLLHNLRENYFFYKAYFLHPFCTVFKHFDTDPFLKPIGKNPRIRSTGLEAGWKPVLFKHVTENSGYEQDF